MQKNLSENISPIFKSSSGFTIIELLAVLAIMGLLLSVILVNLAGGRTDRNLAIAQNELVTNFRKAQSYTLSARQVSPGQNGQLFIIKIDGTSPNSYSLQAVYNIFATPTAPTLVSVENYQLPPGVRFAAANPITIYRPVTPATQTETCALFAFKAPYGKIYINGDFNGDTNGDGNNNCHFTNPNFLAGDDYNNILQYVVNVANYPTTTDSYAVIKLTDLTGSKIKQVMIRGVTGIICPTQDGVSCSSN